MYLDLLQKCTELHDQFGGSYNIKKQIRFKTPVLISDLCDYRDAYIVVKETIIIEGRNNRGIRNRSLAIKEQCSIRYIKD